MENDSLPIGKLPPELLARLLAGIHIQDERVLIGPGTGLDCAVIEMGDRLLVVKTDPVTFASDAIGWYAVQVNANDIATSGAEPRWFLATCLLPPGMCESGVNSIARQLTDACDALGISLIGGHTEITHGIDRPILCGTMIGEVNTPDLITPRGSQPGDNILLTKGIPIETVSLLAREFPDRMRETLGDEKSKQAASYLTDPGISVVRDARVAIKAGKVSAMHDPTEGGLAGALWELADACRHRLVVEPDKVYIPELAAEICSAFQLDPFASLASGALLLTASVSDTKSILQAYQEAKIRCNIIGHVEAGQAEVLALDTGVTKLLQRPLRDEIGKAFNS
jgi:hydrogenase expression/formation protein HypE